MASNTFPRLGLTSAVKDLNASASAPHSAQHCRDLGVHRLWLPLDPHQEFAVVPLDRGRLDRAPANLHRQGEGVFGTPLELDRTAHYRARVQPKDDLSDHPQRPQ